MGSALHIWVIRTTTTFWNPPLDILCRVFDVAGFAMNTILRIDLEHLFAIFFQHLINPGGAITLGRFGIFGEVELDGH